MVCLGLVYGRKIPPHPEKSRVEYISLSPDRLRSNILKMGGDNIFRKRGRAKPQIQDRIG